MQALKLEGALDKSGHLIVSKPISLNPGKVEIIILQSLAASEAITTQTLESDREISLKTASRTKVKTFQDLFTDTNPTSSDLDYDRAKWEYLQDKYDL
ncbi:MAG: hypothetical protein AAGA60_26405 [Cyanobacteria bacterium P01_E01_bin.42]